MGVWGVESDEAVSSILGSRLVSLAPSVGNSCQRRRTLPQWDRTVLTRVYNGRACSFFWQVYHGYSSEQCVRPTILEAYVTREPCVYAVACWLAEQGGVRNG